MPAPKKTKKAAPAAKKPVRKAPAAKAAPKKAAPKKVAVVKQPQTKAQLIAAVADRAEISKAQAKTAVESLVDFAYKGAKSVKGFTIPGLGKLVKVKRKARIGRNPQTGEKIKIKAKTDVKFRLAKACKDAVLA